YMGESLDIVLLLMVKLAVYSIVIFIFSTRPEIVFCLKWALIRIGLGLIIGIASRFTAIIGYLTSYVTVLLLLRFGIWFLILRWASGHSRRIKRLIAG